MGYSNSFENIVQQVLDGIILPSHLNNKILGTKFGCSIKELSRSRFDRRNTYVMENIQWHYGNEELSWGVNLGEGYSSHRLDIMADGKYLCCRQSFVDYVYYEVTLLTELEVAALIENIRLEEIEKSRRQAIVKTLTQILINEMYPYSKLLTGELEIKYGIHLKQIQRAEHRFMKYVPRDGNHEWVASRVLAWGSNTGWDITRDGKIACCRVNYDDYINFEIVALSELEVEDYKHKYPAPNNDFIDRMATLKELLDRNLIDEPTFLKKQEEILATI